MAMKVIQPDHPKRLRYRTCSGDRETLVKRTQIEAPIEAVAKGGQVARRVLSEVEGMVATGQTSLKIAKHRRPRSHCPSLVI